tara:strand:- start:5 stop:304 length:300 start_codon:yes stop_codon:yes gene_type:complete
METSVKQPTKQKETTTSVWRLKKRKPGSKSGWIIRDPEVVRHKRTGYYLIQIRWSNKLTLVHKAKHKTQASAEKLVTQIIDRATVNTEHWVKMFRYSYS